MTKLQFKLWEELDKFDLNNTGAEVGEYLDQPTAVLKNPNSTVFLKEEVPYENFRLEGEVAIPANEFGFIGLVFGVKDSLNFERIYLGPEEIQYDPSMHGSMTWQVYNGPKYQKPLPNITGKWLKFAVEVEKKGARVYLGDDQTPQMTIDHLQHGTPNGKVGFFGFLPSYIRSLTVEEIQPTRTERRETDLQQLQADSFITDWLVSPKGKDSWTQVTVEENGVLNFNRTFAPDKDGITEAKTSFTLADDTETTLSLGYSDIVRLWVNEEEVYHGEEFVFALPEMDGRIRPDYASVPVKWKAGKNTIRAEVTNTEVIFGWGLCVKTGLANLSFLTEE